MGLNQRNTSEGGCPFDNLLKPPNSCLVVVCGQAKAWLREEDAPAMQSPVGALKQGDGESDAIGSRTAQERVPAKVSQLRYPYRILHII